MNTVSLFSLLMFGFALGLKHATDSDHLAAVSTILSERKSFWSASVAGGLWGIGHTISLLTAGVAVIYFQFEISERLARGFELGVALMLVVLGVESLRKLARGGQMHMHRHRHGPRFHVHPHIHNARHLHQTSEFNDGAPQAPTHHGLRIGPRPLVIGLVHGLAGSGALMLLVLSTIASPVVGMCYILIFGIGSIGGMMLMSLVLSLPFRFAAARRIAGLDRMAQSLAGVLSLSFGLFSIFQIVFVQRLFSL